MEYGHLTNRSQFFEMAQDWNRSHVPAGRSYVQAGRATALENGSVPRPIGNIPRIGLNFASQGNFEGGLVEHSSRNFRLEGPVYAPFSGPRNSFPHHPSGGSFCPAQEINVVHTYSSHSNRNIIHEVEGGLPDHTTVAGRGPFKRKCAGISVACERGSTSRFYGVGSSSNSFEHQLDRPPSDYRNYSSGPSSLPPYRDFGKSIGQEDSFRNVRSRSGLDLEPTSRRTLLSSYSSPYPVQVDVANSNFDVIAHEWNHIGHSLPAHERFRASANNHEMNLHPAGQNIADIGGYTYGSTLSSYPIPPPQHLHAPHLYAARKVHNNDSQRVITSYRTGVSSSSGEQEAAAADNSEQFLSETYSSSYPRPLSFGSWHRNNREGRPRLTVERFRPFLNEVDTRDRMRSQDLMMLDHSYLYGSRSLSDQYRDMRLDIDNMGYEELLALGERMGNVSTGLSEDVIRNCLMHTNPSDKSQKGESCAICLEEYKNLDKVGTLQNCSHHYHVYCIKKWLSMKNACPICKAPAFDDSSNRK